jgi:hypothetical protein
MKCKRRAVTVKLHPHSLIESTASFSSQKIEMASMQGFKLFALQKAGMCEILVSRDHITKLIFVCRLQ